ncbi:hypothetical protein DSM3645_02718 [Blastopirellula marina DSM 3645]|uniref:Uncharacterized protein n=1 Tax=Blastopirellula marina DSM 3645 TaxID=314230 RepID=A3ZVK7_9BACT|nr:hypothetical protein DSM3645_02718 [Blastopirellula marina DSM 3645]
MATIAIEATAAGTSFVTCCGTSSPKMFSIR